MKVLVTGAAGQLARAIRSTWTAADLVFPSESVLDLCRRESIDAVIRSEAPDVVINAGAHTQVDRCEEDQERAYLVNGTAVGWLAEACNAVSALLVQISTDYVFDGFGTLPYREGDPTNPRSVYGKSKLLGEGEARKAKDFLILRTAWLYDAEGRNFFNTMLAAAAQGRKLKVVDDQWGSPTSCHALSAQIQTAVAEGWRGLAHATSHGQTTWYRFAVQIFKEMGLSPDLSPCSSAEYPVPAPRPAYSVLSPEGRRALGTDRMDAWEVDLAGVAARARALK